VGSHEDNGKREREGERRSDRKLSCKKEAMEMGLKRPQSPTRCWKPTRLVRGEREIERKREGQRKGEGGRIPLWWSDLQGSAAGVTRSAAPWKKVLRLLLPLPSLQWPPSLRWQPPPLMPSPPMGPRAKIPSSISGSSEGVSIKDEGNVISRAPHPIFNDSPLFLLVTQENRVS